MKPSVLLSIHSGRLNIKYVLRELHEQFNNDKSSCHVTTSLKDMSYMIKDLLCLHNTSETKFYGMSKIIIKHYLWLIIFLLELFSLLVLLVAVLKKVLVTR